MTRSFLTRTPSLLIFITCLALFTICVTLAAHYGLMSTSFVKTLGKTLCLCLAALAMDLIWGYEGILSLGHMAFFALGGYIIRMWLMYARTEEIVVASLINFACPPHPRKSSKASPHKSSASSGPPTCQRSGASPTASRCN